MDSSSYDDQQGNSRSFGYNPNADEAGSSELCGILEIYVHHARNIHNICIYEKQDVYAKFSLTYNPDETFSTRIVHGGGKNPEFNEKLVIKLINNNNNNNQLFDAVVKCEMWMLSRAKNFMEDQLLGFSLVPVSLLVPIGKGEVLTQDFSLSSTDLFHSPAGTVKLSLSLNTTTFNDDDHSIMIMGSTALMNESSIMSEVVLLDPIEIEFPDMNVVRENQQMVSEYFGPAQKAGLIGHGSFLCLGGANNSGSDDYEMVACNNSGSTMTSLSDDRNSSADSLEKKNNINSVIRGESSSKEKEIREKKIDVKEELSSEIMQQQIVDMYMRSMQQFTESLAKMKLPLNLEKTTETEEEEEEEEDGGGMTNMELQENSKKKDVGARVFYGSRAFF